ncbi:efflux RND transporter periplasmic adaptor subunit [Duganella sp. Leaf126]|uniref:efflux RND transporter periplasmic adaptor subunit n=1 Tax=Duganella sp. Leaf126 TaxID=1736266 RepID=UPI0009EB1D85|nr:efflux RND transporter periplasmic adaptor subunit [Duganella sp. Leaf126]
MMKKQFIIGAIVVVLASPFAVQAFKPAKGKRVESATVTLRKLSTSVLASGTLAFQEQVQLSPEVIGKVTRILVKEGDHVTPGQELLLIDEKAYRAEVEQQEAAVRQQRLNIQQQDIALANQKDQLDRKKDLNQRGYITKPQLEDAQFSYDRARLDLRISQENLAQAEAVLRQSRERLAKTIIRAPLSGTVTAVDIKLGETAVASQIGIPGASMMTIANTDSLMAEVNVDEADMSSFNLDSKVALYVSAYPDAPLQGKVRSISMQPRKPSEAGANAQGKTYSVKVSLQQPEGIRLRPGMTFRAEIYAEQAGQLLTVPVQAVLSNNDENGGGQEGSKRRAPEVVNYVFVNNGGVAEKRLVKLGVSNDQYQAIVNGLRQDETVVTGPYRELRHLVDGDSLDHPPAPPASRAAAATGTYR